MGRGCFGLFGGFLAVALLSSTFGCGQNVSTDVKETETELTNVKTEGECCGGCCSEETSTKAEECCGQCEKDKGTEVASKECCGKCAKDKGTEVASKECCGKCKNDTSVLTSTKAESKETAACQSCKDNKDCKEACKECQKANEGVKLETSAALQQKDETK